MDPGQQSFVFSSVDRSVLVNSDRLKPRCFFIVSANAFADCSSLEAKGEFYQILSGLLRSVRPTGVVVIVNDSNTEVWCLRETRRHIGGPFSIQSDRTNDSNRLNQVCSYNRPFLVNVNSYHRKHLLIDFSLYIHVVGLRLTTLVLVMSVVSQPKVVDHSGLQLWTQITL